MCPVHFPYHCPVHHPCPIHHPYHTGPRVFDGYIRHALPSRAERLAGTARPTRSRRTARPAPPPRRGSRHLHFTPPSSSVRPDISEQRPGTTHNHPIRTTPRDVREPTINEEPERTRNEVPFKMPSTYSLGIPEEEVRHHWPLLTAAIQRCQAEDGFTPINLVDLMAVVVEFGKGKVVWNGRIRMDKAGNMYATQALC